MIAAALGSLGSRIGLPLAIAAVAGSALWWAWTGWTGAVAERDAARQQFEEAVAVSDRNRAALDAALAAAARDQALLAGVHADAMARLRASAGRQQRLRTTAAAGADAVLPAEILDILREPQP